MIQSFDKNSFLECGGWRRSTPSPHSKKWGSTSFYLAKYSEAGLPLPCISRTENLFLRFSGRLYATINLLTPTGTPSAFSMSGRGVSPFGWRTSSCQSFWILRVDGSSGWNCKWRKSWLRASLPFYFLMVSRSAGVRLGFGWEQTTEEPHRRNCYSQQSGNCIHNC